MDAPGKIIERYVFLITLLTNAGDDGLTLKEIKMEWERKYGFGSFFPRSFHRQRDGIAEAFPCRIDCFFDDETSEYRYRLILNGSNSQQMQTAKATLSTFALSWELSDSRLNMNKIYMSDTYSNPQTVTVAMGIKSNHTIKFSYKRDHSFYRNMNWGVDTFALDGNEKPDFSEEELKDFIAEYEIRPFFLVFETRWFVIGAFQDTGLPCVFCLDRISKCTVTDNAFTVKDMEYSVIAMNAGKFFPIGTGALDPDDRMLYIFSLGDKKRINLL